MSDESKKAVSVRTPIVSDLAFTEISKLQMTDTFKDLVSAMPEHAQMLETIKAGLPEVHRATSLFMKAQSQFMDNMLTVSANTPIRNMRQILAEMNKVREAISEASFKLKKSQIELRRKQRQLESLTNEDGSIKLGSDELDVELLDVEIMEILTNAEAIKGYMSGAIRKLANYTEQYQAIEAAHGVGEFTEVDFEEDEERYHIMKAFEQGLCAARSHGGVIDEGNIIYFTQIGVNGAHAQSCVLEYLYAEEALLKQDKAPTHKAYRDFLDRMATTFKGCSKEFAKAKGMTTASDSSLLKRGDDRLIKGTEGND